MKSALYRIMLYATLKKILPGHKIFWMIGSRSNMDLWEDIPDLVNFN